MRRDATDERTVLLVLSGELDLSRVDQVRDEVLACGEGTFLVVDTTKVTFIDSAGLGVLVEARNAVGADRFRLVPGDAALRVLELSGTTDYLLD